VCFGEDLQPTTLIVIHVKNKDDRSEVGKHMQKLWIQLLDLQCRVEGCAMGGKGWILCVFQILSTEHVSAARTEHEASAHPKRES
jgi:hypothetical protein